jgi:N-hydroxyarylamine O-acetyltransferase
MDRGARSDGLASELIERVLSRLGLSAPPEPSLDGLKALYGAWCHRVPFDNVRKLIHLRRQDSAPLPGDTAPDFFEAWLRYGTGGTCWAGNGALQSLLHCLGFDAQRGLATMLVAPGVPPNHGTVVVRCEEDRRYIVDASILHGEPLLLDATAASVIEHPAWGVSCAMREGHWILRWRPLHVLDGIDCRIERLQVTAQSFQEAHAGTRAWSPFNYALYARSSRGDTVFGTAFGQRVELAGDGSVRRSPLPPQRRAQLLIEEFGMHEALVERLPADLPLPPPPSRPP